MDKKINHTVKIFFLLIFLSSYMDSHSQQLYSERLDWKAQKEAVKDLYNTMQNFANDTTPIVVNDKVNVVETNLSDFFYNIFKKKKVKKQIVLQKQIRKNEIKKYLASNFVIINDTVESFIFRERNQIKEWAKNMYLPYFIEDLHISTNVCIKDTNVFILIIYGCSGIPCLSFYIFKEKDDVWELKTTSQARIIEKLNIRVDNEQEKILFETASGQIGELPFNILP